MRLLVLSAAIAATVMGALPASAEVVIRADEGGAAVHERDGVRHDNNWRNHRAECREMRVRTRENGHIVFRTRSSC
jgi:hypothetical protein